MLTILTRFETLYFDVSMRLINGVLLSCYLRCSGLVDKEVGARGGLKRNHSCIAAVPVVRDFGCRYRCLFIRFQYFKESSRKAISCLSIIFENGDTSLHQDIFHRYGHIRPGFRNGYGIESLKCACFLHRDRTAIDFDFFNLIPILCYFLQVVGCPLTEIFKDRLGLCNIIT